MYNNNVVEGLYSYIKEKLNPAMVEAGYSEFKSIIMDGEEDDKESEVNVVLLSYENQNTNIIYDINVYHTGKNAAETRKHMEVVSKLLHQYYTDNLCELREGVLLQRFKALPAQAIHKMIIAKAITQCQGE